MAVLVSRLRSGILHVEKEKQADPGMPFAHISNGCTWHHIYQVAKKWKSIALNFTEQYFDEANIASFSHQKTY